MKLYIILILSLTSCSTNFLHPDLNLNNVTETMKMLHNLIEEMRLQEAIDTFSKLEANGRRWCMSISRTTKRCQGGRFDSPTQFLITEIENAKKCQVVLKECESFETFRKTDLYQCKSRLRENCKVRNRDDADYPNAYNRLLDRVQNKLKSAKYGSIHMTKKELSRIDECSDKTVWKYQVTKSNIPSTLVFYAQTRYGLEIGSFKTKKKCDVARENSPKSKRRGLTFDRCFRRYTGSNSVFCKKYL